MQDLVMLPITQALITEHTVFTTVFNTIEQQLPGLRTVEEVKLLGSLVESLLEEHGATETDLAYVALDHALDHDGQLDKLHEEHHEIDGGLRRVQAATTLKEAQRLLTMALRSTREHFKHEEHSVFPLLEKMLQTETLAQLGGGWMEQRRAQA
jgi:hemerythrin-like domain-containing protein